MKTENFFDYEETINESYLELKKGYMAIEEFLNSYSWDIEPTPQKALKYACSTNHNEYTLDEEMSYRLLAEYNKMIWLIQIASDYCYNATQALEKALEYEADEISTTNDEIARCRDDINALISNIDNYKDLHKIQSFIKGYCGIE